MNRSSLMIVLSVTLSLSMLGCPSTRSAESEKAAIAHAQDAAMLLGRRLKERLSLAMSQGGPLAAVEVCSKEAQSIRAAVETETGVKVGRASQKLRNPKDDGPAWVDAWLAAQTKGQTPTGFAKIEAGSVRVVKPIVIEAVCLTCHGEPSSIAPEVRDAIEKNYPEDRATGYQLGDLRGALWAEATLPSSSH